MTDHQYRVRPKPPKCVCGSREWRVDRHRQEVEKKRRPCRCHYYSFPHRRGSGYCIHNTRITADDMRDREEKGNWA